MKKATMLTLAPIAAATALAGCASTGSYGCDGKYYCRRSDGTTGLIVGGIAGGVLGNVIAPGDSKTLGTVIGAIGGAVAGNAIDRGSKKDDVRCR